MMKFSTKARYGIRALLDIALHAGEGPILLRDVAQRQEVSPPYLEHLIAPLVTAGILRSMRGARGGIWLAKPAQEIKLSEVIPLLEGPIAVTECIADPTTCPRSDFCVTHEVWGELTRAISGVLESTTIQDLVERQKRKATATEAMYYI